MLKRSKENSHATLITLSMKGIRSVITQLQKQDMKRFTALVKPTVQFTERYVNSRPEIDRKALGFKATHLFLELDPLFGM
jgi:hypothetical protein